MKAKPFQYLGGTVSVWFDGTGIRLDNEANSDTIYLTELQYQQLSIYLRKLRKEIKDEKEMEEQKAGG